MSQDSDRQPERNPDTQPFDPAAYRMERSLGYLMSRVKSRLQHDVDQEVSALDITHAQASCLMILATGNARTVTDLGREMDTDMGSITRLLDRMEKRGLVERQRSEADRRVVQLSVTDAGRAVVDALPALFCRVLNRYFRDFTDAEIDTFRTMLLRVLATNG